MISRRALPLIAASAMLPLPGLAALPVPPGNVLNCRALRNGDEIGTARYRFEPSGADLLVEIAIDIVIKFGPIPVFRYTHRSAEHWAGDRLMAVESKTDDDGTPKFMTLRRGASGMMVTGSKTDPYIAPEGAMGTSYWDSRTISSPLINTEDGRLLKVTITPAGENLVKLANGASISARQYNMTGEMSLEFWYDKNNELASMRLPAKDGSFVVYERL